MNLSRKVSLLVVLSSLIVLLPSLIVFYNIAKDELLENELAQLEYQVQIFADDFASDIGAFSSNLERLDQLINRKIHHTDEKDIVMFDQIMTKSEDEAWRNKKERFDGRIHPGLFLPPDINLTAERKRFYVRMLNIFESFGASSNSKKTFVNVWFLGHDRESLIFDLSYPNFIYLLEPDNDYTTTEWMTLASPDRNHRRETKWTPPLFDHVSKTWMVSAVHPLDIDSEWIGTLGQDVQLSLLFRLIDSVSDKFEGEQHILQDQEGGFILGGPWQDQLEAQPEKFTIPASEAGLLQLLDKTINHTATVHEEIMIQGKPYQAISIKIQPMNWSYLHLVPTKDILEPLVHMLYIASLFLVITALSIALLISGVVRNKISKPIENIVERTRVFAKGDQPGPVDDWGSQELTELSQALDIMNEDLQIERGRLKHMATHDELTALPNRNLLSERLEHIISGTRANHTKAAVLFLDLDQFKAINDTLGHSFGDKFLKNVAERISFEVGEQGLVSRFGGDEFVIIIPDFKHIVEISNIVEKILFVIKQPYIIESHDLTVTGSIGISICPDDAETAEALIQNADTAMYLSKANGRSAYRFYTEEIHQQVLRKHQLEEALRKAIQEQQFVLYYQPKINLLTGQIFGLEALIRWQHPTLGIVPPNEFIPSAEEMGLIMDIGDWVIKQACTDMKVWSEQFSWLTTMSINLSTKQFQHDDFARHLKRLITSMNVPVSKIDLEITESMIMDDVRAAIEVLTELRNFGVSISIDDFGTGYSSLSYLKQLPANTLKIDRAFVMELVNDKNDQAITKSIIALATNLNLSVIAEGIEYQEQANMLTDMGCKFAQGYLYSRPIPADEMQALLENQQNHLS